MVKKCLFITPIITFFSLISFDNWQMKLSLYECAIKCH